MSRLNVANFRHPDGTDDNINLTSAGRVGIGTTSPNEVFDSRGAAVFSGDHGTSQNAYGTAHGILLSSTSNLASIKAVSNGSNDVSIRFIPLSSGSGSEAMRILPSGDLRFNSGYGSVATAYGVRAWARINGNGTLSEYGKAGFSSITDQSTGVYRFNFTNDMPDTNYAVAGSTDANTIFQVGSTFNTGYFDSGIQSTSATAADSDDVSVIVVR